MMHLHDIIEIDADLISQLYNFLQVSKAYCTTYLYIHVSKYWSFICCCIENFVFFAYISSITDDTYDLK